MSAQLIHNNGSTSTDVIDSPWTFEEDKAFENALAMYPEDEEDRWAMIAAHVPGKTMENIKHHYDLLVDDVRRIEAGIIPMPDYESDDDIDVDGELLVGKKAPRRKGTPWTEQEHKSFLIGLEIYGKGDWRSISRKCVITRSATQIASHAQKYFVRQNALDKLEKKRRLSIHDISTVHPNPPMNNVNNIDSNPLVTATTTPGSDQPSQFN